MRERAALVAALRGGGHVLFFRHADTRGEPCDRSFRVGDRAGQRNISPEGRAQSVRIGARLAEIPTDPAQPVLLICNTQNRSRATLKALRERGYTNVRFVDGGMSEWARRGWPMTKPAP